MAAKSVSERITSKANCIFCQICAGTAPSQTVFRNEKFIAFRARSGAAKQHLLVCPIEHVKDVKSLVTNQKTLVEELVQVGIDVLIEQGEDITNARFGFHWPPFHSIEHLHLHAISPVSDLNFVSRMIYKPNSYWFVSPEYVISRLNSQL